MVLSAAGVATEGVFQGVADETEAVCGVGAASGATNSVVKFSRGKMTFSEGFFEILEIFLGFGTQLVAFNVGFTGVKNWRVGGVRGGL